MDTGTLRAALPEGSAQQPQGRSEHAEKWANPLPYDYEELAQQGPEVPVNWESNARVYEFDMEQFGDVGPEFPELELQLFGPPAERGLNNTGISYDRYARKCSMLLAALANKLQNHRDRGPAARRCANRAHQRLCQRRLAPYHAQKRRDVGIPRSYSHSAVHIGCCSQRLGYCGHRPNWSVSLPVTLLCSPY